MRKVRARNGQIGILADLNGCNKEKIRALELEKMRITLEQEELEDYLEQFQDDV